MSVRCDFCGADSDHEPDRLFLTSESERVAIREVCVGIAVREIERERGGKS